MPYALGTITPILVTSSTPKFTATGNLYLPPSQATGLNSSGTFLMQIADNTTLTPGGTTWSFKVCSAIGTVQLAFGTGPQCFTVTGITISGASQSLTSTLTAAAVALTLPFGTGTGTIGGAGTAGNVPVFTAGTTIGNSLITSCAGAQTCASGSTTGQVQIGGAIAPLTAQVGETETATPAPTACGGSNVVPLPVFGCIGNRVAFTNNASSTADVATGLQVKSLPSNNVAGTLGVGISSQAQAGFNETETRGIYSEAYENVAATVTTRRGFYAFAGNGTGNTTATNEGGVFQTGATSSTNTNDYTVHILTPNNAIGGSGGTMTNHVGLQIEDQTQTATGGTNSNPRSIVQLGNASNIFQGHLSQNASGNWAGTCTMSTTTCTITLTANYTATPGCVATVQGATPIAAACSVSGATVTITAASSNTATWAAMLFGNPN